MAINDWWTGDDAERFWMEITDRADLGVDLNAPTRNGADREEWGYTLVTETQPGDVILHWHKHLVGRPALVGWSTVVGPLAVEDDYKWMAHGTRGRMRGRPTTGQGWRMPCAGLERLAQPIDKVRLAELEPQLREVHDEMSRRINGGLYFPFMFYRPGEVRAAQTYLTKFPAALIPLFSELAPLTSPADSSASAVADVVAGHPTIGRDGGARRMQDGKLRRAIEMHAVRAAKEHYLRRGATKVDELGKPYDLLVTGLGPDRHVEVKGSSGEATAIDLTVNEVTHAHNHQPTDLVLVDKINVVGFADGEYETSGGNLRVCENWKPDQQRLAPTQYLYQLDADECVPAADEGPLTV